MEFANSVLDFITALLERMTEFLEYVEHSSLPEQTGYAIAYCIKAWFNVYLPVIAHWLEVIIYEG